MAVPSHPSQPPMDLWNMLAQTWNRLTGQSSSELVSRYEARPQWEPPNILQSSAHNTSPALTPVPSAMGGTVFKTANRREESEMPLASEPILQFQGEVQEEALQTPDDSSICPSTAPLAIELGARDSLPELEYAGTDTDVEALVNNFHHGMSASSQPEVQALQALIALMKSDSASPVEAIEDGYLKSDTGERLHTLHVEFASMRDETAAFVASDVVPSLTVAQHRRLAAIFEHVIEKNGSATRSLHRFMSMIKFIPSESMDDVSKIATYLKALSNGLVLHQKREGVHVPTLAFHIQQLEEYVKVNLCHEEIASIMFQLFSLVWPLESHMEQSFRTHMLRFFEVLRKHSNEDAAPADSQFSLSKLIRSQPLRDFPSLTPQQRHTDQACDIVRNQTAAILGRVDGAELFPPWNSAVREFEGWVNSIQARLGHMQRDRLSNFALERAAYEALWKAAPSLDELAPYLEQILMLKTERGRDGLSKAARIILHRILLEPDDGLRQIALRDIFSKIATMFPQAILDIIFWVVRTCRQGTMIRPVQATCIRSVFDLFGAESLRNFLHRLHRAHLPLYPNPLCDIVVDIAKKDPDLAMSIYHFKPCVLRSYQQAFMFRLIGKRPPSDVFLLLQYSEPRSKIIKDLKDGKQISPELLPHRVKLVHNLARCFAKARNCTTRVALRSVYDCYKYLKLYDAPIGPEFARAFVQASVINGLERGEWIGTERFLWILEMVRKLEGEETAQRLDQVTFKWRERVGEQNQKVGILRLRQRGEKLVWVPDIKRFPYRKRGVVIRPGGRSVLGYRRQTTRTRSWMPANMSDHEEMRQDIQDVFRKRERWGGAHGVDPEAL